MVVQIGGKEMPAKNAGVTSLNYHLTERQVFPNKNVHIRITLHHNYSSLKKGYTIIIAQQVLFFFIQLF